MNGNCERAVIFADADNTLWDTDRIFADAQLKLLDDVAAETQAQLPGNDRLCYVRRLDQHIAERHPAGLRYPPRLLATALALALTGKSPDAQVLLASSGCKGADCIPDETAIRLEAAFLTMLMRWPELRAGVRNGLARLKHEGHFLVIVTAGSLERVKRTTHEYGLDPWIDRVVGAKKTPRFFRQCMRALGPTAPAFMVGDQLHLDIRPAKQAGLYTIFFPGSFRPRWEPDEADVRPDRKITSFDEVPRIVQQILQQPRVTNGESRT